MPAGAFAHNEHQQLHELLVEQVGQESEEV